MPDFFTILRSCASSRVRQQSRYCPARPWLESAKHHQFIRAVSMIAANGIPCTFPDGELSGVFISPCASNHKYPIRFSSLRKCDATPAATPQQSNDLRPAQRQNPSDSDFSTVLAMSWQVSAISCRYFARFRQPAFLPAVYFQVTDILDCVASF